MKYQKHLYMIVYPINALVASQLDPEDFGLHYSVGSSKHYRGKVIFTEIDINFRNPYFEIERYLSLTVPHDDGRPKRTKFISSYGVLEHIDLKAIMNLYLVTSNGKVLELKKGDYTAINAPGMIRIYQEICPLETLVASKLDQREFGTFITTISKSKGAPKILFTQVDFNIDEFYEMNKGKEMISSRLPEVNGFRLKECLEELKRSQEKKTKTISLGSLLREVPFSYIRHGFWFEDGSDLLFFPIPSEEDMESKYFGWWKYASR